MSPVKIYGSTLGAGVVVLAGVALMLHVLGVFAGWPLWAFLAVGVSAYIPVVLIASTLKERAEDRIEERGWGPP